MVDNPQAQPPTVNNSGLLDSSSLSSPVWFFYPQTGGVVNFSRRKLRGVLSVGDDRMIITSDTGETLIDRPLSLLRKVSSMASKGMLSAPVMTFYFNDGSVFQMDFRDPALLTKDVSRISLLGVFGIFFIKRMHGDRRTGMEAIKPFEEYFRRKGLLPS